MRTERTLYIIVVLITLALVLCASIFEIASPDLFFHIRMGQDLLWHGLSPWLDHYSFTYPEMPITNVAWPFQILTALAVEAFGLPLGIVILRLVFFMLSGAVLLRLLKDAKISALVTALALFFFVLVLLYHSEPRPDLGSYLPTLLSIGLVYKLNLEFRWRYIACFTLLLALWSNYHVSSVFGFVIAGAWLIEGALNRLIHPRKAPSWKQLGASGLCLVGAGFLTHDQHPLLAQNKVGENWARYITEYETKTYFQSELFIQIFFVLLLLAFIYHLWRQRWSAVVVIAVLGLRTWSMSKLFPHLIVANLLFVSVSLEAVRRWARQKARLPKSMIDGLLWIVVLALASQAFNWTVLHPVHPLNGQLKAGFVSDELDNYILEHKLTGNVLNEYSDGGHLILKHAPALKVFIDGRTSILYPIAHMDLYQRISAIPSLLKEQAERDHVDFVVARVPRSGELLDAGLKSKMFTLEFMGRAWALLSRTGKYRLASSLFANAECLRSYPVEALGKELEFARAELPEDSPLRVALEIVARPSPGTGEEVLSLVPRSEPHVQSVLAEVTVRRGNKRSALTILLSKAMLSSQDIFRAIGLDCEISTCEHREILLNKLKGIRTAAELTRTLAILDRPGAPPLVQFPPARVARMRAALVELIAHGESPLEDDYCVRL